MLTTYRVEAHDGKGWNFGIQRDTGAGLPGFCGVRNATTGTREEMDDLKERASQLCGGTLRVAEVPEC